jgi:putative DNA primase/helicase
MTKPDLIGQIEQLTMESVLESPPPTPQSASTSAADGMSDFIRRYGIKTDPPVRWRNGTKWLLTESCFFNPTHSGAALFVTAAGKRHYRCPSCPDKDWLDVFLRFEPESAQHVGFELRPDGVWHREIGQSPVFVCGPLRVVALSRDDHSDHWGREVAWHDDDHCEHVEAIPMSMLAGDGAGCRELLLSGGLEIPANRRSRELLLAYLQLSKPQDRVRAVGRLGWNGNCYVLPDQVIGPVGRERIRYQTEHHVEDFHRVAGTLPDWQQNVARMCVGNSRLKLGVSMAFAAALATPLEQEGRGIHSKGVTTLGKSTQLLVAGSVLGGGGARGFTRTWRSTANALELIAAVHNDALLLLDEIRELADPREAGEITYMLANGSGKSRSTRAITPRRSLSWRLLFLSSGEVALSEVAAAGGRSIKGGAEIRLMNVPADAGAGMGLFEQLHDIASPAEFAEQLATAAKTYYGTAFRAFLSELVTDPDHHFEAARQTMSRFIAEVRPAAAAPEVIRGLRTFALIAAGGELATAMGITRWTEGTAWAAARTCFGAWVADRGGAGGLDLAQAVEQVRLFIAAHGQSRFQPTTVRYDRGGNQISDRIANRAGFVREADDGRLYLAFPAVFRKEICAGHDYRAVARELDRQGHLVRNEQDHWTMRVDDVPEGARFICIRSTILTPPAPTKNENHDNTTDAT